MYAEKETVRNASGLHARPASEFVQTAKKFQSKIKIRNLSAAGAMPVNAKSITMLLSQGISMNSEVEITAEGADEQDAVRALTELIRQGCGEALC